jgi:hypothetical protein
MTDTEGRRWIERFHAYAAAFESAYATDDWALLEPYFTEDATSELNGARVEGRAAVLASFRDGVHMFDRRFDSRALRLTLGPIVEDGCVRITATVRYERAGLEPLDLVGDEWFAFEGDRIKRHVDRVVNGAAVMEYLVRHGEALRPMA